MEQLTDGRARIGGHRRPPIRVLCWVLALGVLTTAGLGALSWGLLVLEVLSYGALSVFGPELAAAAPDSGRHGQAFAVGVAVHVTCAVALTLLASGTAVRSWPPLLQGLGTTIVAAAAAACALLLTLGIDPIDFLLGR